MKLRLKGVGEGVKSDRLEETLFAKTTISYKETEGVMDRGVKV